MQIQVNALLLLLERHAQQLISEGVQTVGLETMEGIKMRLYEGIMQQAEKENETDIINVSQPFASVSKQTTITCHKAALIALSHVFLPLQRDCGFPFLRLCSLSEAL
jgi:hypothetical protein